MAEQRLLMAHPAEEAIPVLRKLQQLARTLNTSTHKVGVALFVSEEVSKAIYLSSEPEEKVIVDEPFLVRDIADYRAESRDFLVLLLSSKESKMYLRDRNGFKLIKSNTPQNVYAYLNEVPERSGNFSDPESRREVMLNKFLHYMDMGLGAVLKVYPLPVFVIATERVAGHFGQVTHNSPRIAGYIHKDGIDMDESSLGALLEPQLAEWGAMRVQLLLRQMEAAALAGRLACGVHEARKAAGCRNTRVIIVGRGGYEKDHADFYSGDEIDGLVEKALESGGDVEKLDRELLRPYGPVAVIKYY